MNKEIEKIQIYINNLELENVELNERLEMAMGQIEAYGLSEEDIKERLCKDEQKKHKEEIDFIYW